ncbi:MAG TPA: LCP family protein [Anaerolineaceae bacterium]|nr:LCP family protein [Anaerolineaceae bacterium]
MTQIQHRRVKPKSKLLTDRLTLGLFAAFVVLALASAFVAFTVVKDLIASWTMTDVGGVQIDPNSANAPVVAGTLSPDPLQAATGPTPQPWDGASRINILMLGLDARDWDSADGNAGDPARSDTMILLTMDPLSKTAGMLSIPRDLWVNIPSYGYGKINMAYFLGDVNQMPGGGPGLAMQTVQEFLGVPIHYYAQIDFNAFVDFIDTLGGIEINVPEEIKVDPLGQHNTVILQPGVQTISGDVALGYARNRYTANGDFDRSNRQQQVIMAIRDKVVNLNMLSTLVANAPTLYQQLSSGVHTNLTMEQIISLAWTAKDIAPENITQRVIGLEQVSEGTSPEGWFIYKPITDKIRLLRDEIFTTGGPLSPAATEGASIMVKNGTGVPGLGSRTTDYLKGFGLNLLEPGNADELLGATTIYDYTGKPYTMKYLVDTLNIDKSRIFNSYDPNAQVDIVIILGSDWANSNPMP